MNITEHLLTCLMEEAAEIQQACAKALRFGLTDGYPDSGTTNAEDIDAEFNDLLAVVDLLQEHDVLKLKVFTPAIDEKKARVRHYMNYAAEKGALVTP